MRATRRIEVNRRFQRGKQPVVHIGPGLPHTAQAGRAETSHVFRHLRDLVAPQILKLPPIEVLFARAGEGGVDSWMYLLAFIWAGIFVFFPLFNKDRLRLGDLVGGTWVVRTPRRKLTRDMADDGASRLTVYDFTPAQIDAYGAKELHVLESVLRQSDRKTKRAVADRIATKIGWTRDPLQSDSDFLSAYYAALRGRLEEKLLMGVRRRDKHDV
jgi:hypothetical protein